MLYFPSIITESSYSLPSRVFFAFAFIIFSFLEAKEHKLGDSLEVYL